MVLNWLAFAILEKDRHMDNSKRSNIAGYLVFMGVLLIGIWQMVHYYPQMPKQMASHFDARGNVNGWMTPGAFVMFHAGQLLFLMTMVLIVRFLIPRTPASLINLPHKEYWLAPERRKQTDAAIFGGLLWMFNATAIFLTFVLELGYLVNLGYTDAMRWLPWVFLGGYILFIAMSLFFFYRRFSKLPNNS
jgi:uncharacterized membrane protein